MYSYLTCILLIFSATSAQFCTKEDSICSKPTTERYILYDINPPEGFNLRRDVYLRCAIFAHKLQKSSNENLRNFKLVLPPWSHMYHWRRKEVPEHLPWSKFFDLESLKRFAPVVEMYEFFRNVQPQKGKVVIDEVYVLQHFEDMFETGNFEDKMSIEDCQTKIQTNFFYYNNITAHRMNCLSFHGPASLLAGILETTDASSVLFDHAEVALHDAFGDRLYWQARRSMRFNKELRKIAEDFRRRYLNSSDEMDDTSLPEDWRSEKPKRRAKGGPYLAIHLRRKDFVWGHSKSVPSISSAAKQIVGFLKVQQLTTVFIATDTDDESFEDLKNGIGDDYKVVRYIPNQLVLNEYGDGGVAIIDQIICSNARFFIGTHESTFSYRIQEEREILGFPVFTTFNRLCGDKEEDCQPPSSWKIVF